MEKADQIMDFLKDFRRAFIEFRDETNRRLDLAHEERRDLKDELRNLRKDFDRYREMLLEVYESRNKVRVQWCWKWAFASVVMAFAASSFAILFSSSF